MTQETMSSHLTKHRAEMARQAWPAVERFIQEHPQYTLDADQSGSIGNTNYVIFGHSGERAVVFKYFCRDERKERKARQQREIDLEVEPVRERAPAVPVSVAPRHQSCAFANT